jgi:cell wall-associated NlpC family hydrolase
MNFRPVPNALLPAEAPEWVSRYVGLPYVEKGRSRHGVDCYGLVWLVMGEQFNRALPCYGPDFVDAFDLEDLAALRRGEVVARWAEVEAGTEQIGDAILLSLSGEPCHFGIVVARGQFLHAMRRNTRVGIDRYDRRAWRNRITGFCHYVA